MGKTQALPTNRITYFISSGFQVLKMKSSNCLSNQTRRKNSILFRHPKLQGVLLYSLRDILCTIFVIPLLRPQTASLLHLLLFAAIKRTLSVLVFSHVTVLFAKFCFLNALFFHPVSGLCTIIRDNTVHCWIPVYSNHCANPFFALIIFFIYERGHFIKSKTTYFGLNTLNSCP